MTLPSLDPYLDLVAELPLPTEGQTEQFVQFVAGAHSWYKHLPPLPPGSRFVFFLNPNVGRNQVHTRGGETAFVDRTEDDGTRFHYTWLPTADYRDRFGYWDYYCDAAPQFMLLGGGVSYDLRSRVNVLDREGEWVQPAAELLDAASCELTGLVHERLNPGTWWRHRGSVAAFEALAASRPEDPDVVRYRSALRDLRGFVDQDAPRPSAGAFERLEAFHSVETERQRQHIREALTRGLQLLARERRR